MNCVFLLHDIVLYSTYVLAIRFTIYRFLHPIMCSSLKCISRRVFELLTCALFFSAHWVVMCSRPVTDLSCALPCCVSHAICIVSTWFVILNTDYLIILQMVCIIMDGLLVLMMVCLQVLQPEPGGPN